RSIENTFIEANNSKILYTVSIGLACLLDKNIASKMLLKNADAALYKAKENGRNRIEIFTT
ncbi:diguanylate cyclase, partial [Nitrosomonas aestuarii]